MKDKENAFEAWGGIPGVQNNVDVLFDEGVQKRGMSLKMFADIIATNPADLYSLDSKGRISIGKDADFVLIKPNAPYTLKTRKFQVPDKISRCIGREIGAQVAPTILRGETVYHARRRRSGHYRPGQFILK